MTIKDERNVTEAARSTRRKTREGQGVVIYTEFSITMRVSNDSEYVKFVVGHERMSPSDSEEALNRTERAAWRWNERTADRRVRMLQRMMRQIASERESRV